MARAALTAAPNAVTSSIKMDAETTAPMPRLRRVPEGAGTVISDTPVITTVHNAVSSSQLRWSISAVVNPATVKNAAHTASETHAASVIARSLASAMSGTRAAVWVHVG